MILLESFDEDDRIAFAHHENGHVLNDYVEHTGTVTNVRRFDNADIVVLEVETDDGKRYELEQSDIRRGDNAVSVTRVSGIPSHMNMLATQQVEKIEQ